MATIWNWSIKSFSQNELLTNNLTVRSDLIPKNTNIFAQAYISKFATFIANPPAATPWVQAYISQYAQWQADGTEGPVVNTTGNTGTAFIENCAWVEIQLDVRSADAIANLTLIEWG